MSDDEVVASYVVYTALLDVSSHLYERVCSSIHPCIGQSFEGICLFFYCYFINVYSFTI